MTRLFSLCAAFQKPRHGTVSNPLCIRYLGGHAKNDECVALCLEQKQGECEVTSVLMVVTNVEAEILE